MRRYWLTTLLAVGVAAIVLTYFYLPYASGSGAGRRMVRVMGGQFLWSISPGPRPRGHAASLRRLGVGIV